MSAKGRLANLVLSEGHPSEIRDISFTLQSLMSEYFVKNKEALKPSMVNVPVDIDSKVGFLKLKTMGMETDTLTEEQYNYIHGYLEGTLFNNFYFFLIILTLDLIFRQQ